MSSVLGYIQKYDDVKHAKVETLETTGTIFTNAVAATTSVSGNTVSATTSVSAPSMVTSTLATGVVTSNGNICIRPATTIINRLSSIATTVSATDPNPAVLAAIDVLTGYVSASETGGLAYTIELPTGPHLAGEISPAVAVGDSFECVVLNTTAGAATITSPGVSIILAGTVLGTAAANSAVLLKFVCTDATVGAEVFTVFCIQA